MNLLLTLFQGDPSSSTPSFFWQQQKSLKSISETDDSTISSAEPPRGVRFHPNVTKRVFQKHVESHEVWYSSTELKNFRAEAEQKGTSVNKKPFTSKLMLVVLSDRATENKKQEMLDAWARKEHRGMEECSSLRYARTRAELQRGLWAAILEAQAQSCEPEVLREISLEWTATFREYALLMGEADSRAAAAAWGEGRSKTRKSISRVKSILKRSVSFRKTKNP